MNCRGRIGEITAYDYQTTEWKLTVHWKINDFLSQPGEDIDCYDSPEFGSPYGRFFMRIFPNWMNRIHPNSDWVRIDFCRDDPGPTRVLDVTLGIRGINTWLTNEKNVKRDFGNKDVWHSVDFCLRSQLINQESRLMPNNVLTIKCEVKSFEYNLKCVSSFDDASIQTDPQLTGLVVPAIGSQTLDEQDEDGEEDDNEDGEEDDDEDDASSSEIKNTLKVSLPSRHDNVIRSLKAIQDEGRRSDFRLKSGHREWRVHRAILESGNEFFSAMFGEEWSECTEGEIPPGGMAESVLQFIYTGQIEGMSVDNVCGLYDAAHRFQSQGMRSMCVEYMTENMCVEMVCDALAVAKAHGDEDLSQLAMEYFLRESNRVFDTEGWRQLKQSHLPIIGELLKEIVKRRRESQGEC